MEDEPERPDEATPRWVKVFAALALVVVVVFVVLLVAGRGDHGPSRHGAAVSVVADAV